MSEAGYWKWVGAAKKRLEQSEKFDPMFIKHLEEQGWLWIEKASDEEDRDGKFDHHMVSPSGKWCKVDFKLAGVQDAHVRHWNKGKRHEVTHYAFGNKYSNKDELYSVEIVSVEYFMANKRRLVNTKSGQTFWKLKPASERHPHQAMRQA